MIIAGIGFRSGVTAEAIENAVRTALARAGLQPEGLQLLAAPAFKNEQAILTEAALRLGLPLVLVPREKLEAAASGAVTHSERVVELFGVPSVAETVALAAAGLGAKLILPRMALDGVTCALAADQGAF